MWGKDAIILKILIWLCSFFREVPDHQEVFVEKHGDQSLILEILQLEKQVDAANAAKFYFDDLAESNACSHSDRAILIEDTLTLSPQQVPLFDAGVDKSATLGLQVLGKFNQQDQRQKENVLVYVAVIRYDFFLIT